jgi:hypothetical protein
MSGLGAYRAPSQLKESVMKHLIIPLLLIGGFVALTMTEASAVVCAHGVHRAGCVGAGGAAVVARPVVVAPHARRAVVVAPVRRRVY